MEEPLGERFMVLVEGRGDSWEGPLGEDRLGAADAGRGDLGLSPDFWSLELDGCGEAAKSFPSNSPVILTLLANL